MGSCRRCRREFCTIFWFTGGEGWCRSPNPGRVGGTGLLVGEKVPPRYSCVSQSGATVQHHLPAYPGVGSPAYPGAGASAKTEGVAAPGCQVQLLRFHDPRMGGEVQCSAGKLFYAGRCSVGWGAGAGQCPVRPHPSLGHHTLTDSCKAQVRDQDIWEKMEHWV